MSHAPDAGAIDEVAQRAMQLKANLVRGAILIVIAIGTIALWRWSSADQARAILDLPASERLELYESTRRALQSVCVPTKRPAGLESYCREQALFIRTFPECDAACQRLVQRAGSHPTR